MNPIAAELRERLFVLILTAHPEFDAHRLVAEARLVLYTRNLTGELGSLAHLIRL